jgi:hypothetical protein
MEMSSLYPYPQHANGEQKPTSEPAYQHAEPGCQLVQSQLVLPQISMQPLQHGINDRTTDALADCKKDNEVNILVAADPNLEHAPKSEPEAISAAGETDATKFDWAWLCTPRMPWSKDKRLPAFYGINDKIPFPVAMVMGFQHALAMMGGIITPPILVSGAFYARFTTEETQYLLSVGLICSGILSFTQIVQFKLWGGFVIGTGFISVVGTSFVFLPIAQASIVYQMTQDSSRSCASDADCTMAWAGQTGFYAGVAIPGVTNAGQCTTATQKCKFR